jgi:hypothetical protein
MELENTLRAVEVDHPELIETLTAMGGVTTETPPPGHDVIPMEEALQPLEESMGQLETQTLNFITKAFQPTNKALNKEKKDNLAILSPSLTALKKEFRLPNRADLKPKEGKDAHEGWIDFRNSYHQLVRALIIATSELQKGSSMEVSETLKWSSSDIQQGSRLILLSTIRLLLTGILVRALYSSVLTKAQIEFAHRPYNLAFEALKKYKIAQKLRTARRQARNSPGKRYKALELLGEEEDRFQEVEDKWDKEAGLWERWRYGSGDISQHTFLEQQKVLNKDLGISLLEMIMLPAITEKIMDVVMELTDFVPKPEHFEAALPNHEQEAEEIAESIGNDLSKIRESLEVKEKPHTEEGSNYLQSTPKKKAVSFDERLGQSVLLHSITSLGMMTSKLGRVYAQAKENTNEVKLEILKATLKAAERKANSIDLNLGNSEEISEACTLTDKLDELSIEVAAFVNIQERKDRREREEEKSRNIMVAKALPSGKIPPFNGNREDYFEWATLFQAQCPPTISSVMRANHLRQAIKDPITQNLIKGCQTAEEIERVLKRHFGNKNEELARLLAQIDNIPVPKNRSEEFYNIQELKKLHRKLKVLGEESTIDKIRLTKLVHDIFLQGTKEEFEKVLYEKRDELIQEYSLNYGIEEDAARDLALGEMTKELEITKEDYSAIFWKFLDKKADVGGRMRGAASATGLLMNAPRPTGNFRSNTINPPTELVNGQPGRGFIRKCAFKNCGSMDHFSSLCPNLKPGDVPQDIQQLCLTAGVCMRCLRDLSYKSHDETCQGFYKRKLDNKWIYTDCHTCMVTIPNGSMVNINKRICQHALDRAKANQAQSTRLSPIPNVNSLGVWDNGMGTETKVPPAIVRSSTSIPIANKLVVNEQFCGEASQLVEWVNVQGRYRGFRALTMFDLGTSCSVIDVKLAEENGLQGEEVRFTISTVSGKQEGSKLYTLYLLDDHNRSVKVQALGVDIKQYYPRIKVNVRNSWKGYFKGQPFQRAEGGQLGLLLGSDQSSLHPRQISFEGSEILWKSWLTNRYLITGGRNEQSENPILNKISISMPRDLKKANLSTRVVETKIKDGKVFTIVEDMKEKVFKQISGLDKVLVTPCRACTTCKEETDRMADQDLLEYDALKQTVSFDKETGRYKGDFIYVEDKVKELKGNADYAKKSSENLFRKLHKLPAESVKDFDDAVECAKEMGALKRVREVKGINNGHPRRHIPVNFAFSGKEATTKIRNTYNCGWSRGAWDPSFNDVHLAGPRNLNNLDQSMLFFKTNVIVGLIDIKKFFWTCQVSTRTASMNRIWLPEGGYNNAKQDDLDLQEWCWVTLTFGQAGAPALSGVIRHQAAEDFCQIEKVKTQVKEKALVDDILIGASTKDQFTAYQRDVEQMLEKSGMKYHDWIVSKESSEAIIDFDQKPIKEGMKVFGYTYNQEKDLFSLRVKINLTKATRGKKFGGALDTENGPEEYIKEHGLTKRKALGFTLSLWDLTGWVLPIQMLLRLIYREFLEENKGIGWDEEIPMLYKTRYAKIFKRVMTFDGLSWERAVVPTEDWDEKWGCRLATFFDGSDVASTAYTYLVTRKLSGSFHSRLLWAKGKLGCGTVPRNELGAAFLAVKMNNFLEQYLQIRIRDITYFGDSQVVLYQIASRSVLYDIWARARLRAIQQGSRGATWLYIPAKENVADIGSKESTRISRETMESDFYQKGNFLEDPQWKGIQIGAPKAETLENLPGIKKCYKSLPVTLINTNTIRETTPEADEIPEHLNPEDYSDISLEEASEEELEIISNNMLGKFKRTARTTKINQNLEKDKLPDFLYKANRKLASQGKSELLSRLLLKYRSMAKIKRILALVFKWRYGSEVNLTEIVQGALTRTAAVETLRYLCEKGAGFGPLRLDHDYRVWVKNRPLLGCEKLRILPEETMVLAPTTSLARLISRSYHDDNHESASTAIQTIIRKDLNARIPNLLRMLDQERNQCPRCRHHQRTAYKPEEAGVPLQRHNLKNKPFTSICIDGIGPFKVKSLHRQDKRTNKVWALIAVDQPTGLAHISILMDSSSYSVQVALESLKTEWNVEIDLITLDPATSFVGLQEDEQSNELGVMNGEAVREGVAAAGYHLKLSPPKASWFQALCEKRVDLVKTALYFHPKKILNVVELELILKKIVLDLNNKPVLLRQSQDNFVSLTRMDLLGKFYQAPRKAIFKTGKDLLKDIELIEECVQEGRRVFNEIYTERLRDYSKWKYPGVLPEKGDLVGVPDKEVRGEPRMGRIIEVVSPHEVRVEMARPRKGHPFPEEEVTTRKTIFRRSPHSLYLVERSQVHRPTLDMRKIDGGASLAEYIDKEENETGVGEDSLPPIYELGGEDGDEIDDSELELSHNDDEPTQKEDPLQNLDSEEPFLKGEPNHSKKIESAEMEEDNEEAGTVEPGPSEQPNLGRGKRVKFPSTILTQ